MASWDSCSPALTWSCPPPSAAAQLKLHCLSASIAAKGCSGAARPIVGVFHERRRPSLTAPVRRSPSARRTAVCRPRPCSLYPSTQVSALSWPLGAPWGLITLRRCFWASGACSKSLLSNHHIKPPSVLFFSPKRPQRENSAVMVAAACRG